VFRIRNMNSLLMHNKYGQPCASSMVQFAQRYRIWRLKAFLSPSVPCLCCRPDKCPWKMPLNRSHAERPFDARGHSVVQVKV
jgi:hypothetical protein